MLLFNSFEFMCLDGLDSFLLLFLTLIRPDGEVSGEEVKQGGEEILK